MIRKNEVMDYLKELETNDLLETLYLFGSWANEPENPGRDLDLAVIFTPRLDQERILWDCRDLQAKIAADLQLPVDLIDLEIAPVYLGQVILQTGILIFCKDEERRLETSLYIFRNYQDPQAAKGYPWEVSDIDE
ncbi:MAG TPA: nucleotidyltransferase domain-containing protein [Bacillota bacterium]|nr:nucleotidyltransferase domain-containing protein [Bacillota bacterium]